VGWWFPFGPAGVVQGADAVVGEAQTGTYL